MSDSDDNAGGLGGASNPGIRDTRMAERALRERWPMSEAVRVAILKRLAGIVDPESPEGAKAKRREVISAARALMAADKLNLERERLDLARELAAKDLPDNDDDRPRIIIPGADDGCDRRT